MTHATRSPSLETSAASTPPERDLALGGVATVTVSALTCWLLGIPASRVVVAAALYAAVAVVFRQHFPRSRSTSGVGAANRVTLARTTLVLPLLALSILPAPLSAAEYWWILGLATVATALDGVDGRVARRTATEGPFGARFDMEIDALLILTLSLVTWQSGKMGAWVVMIGLIRYLFVLAGGLWPRLRAPLPPSMARKTICVVQSVTLVVCVAPIIPAWFATGAAAGALALLIYSFARDTAWLVREGSARGA